jgi:hypothetical protein
MRMATVNLLYIRETHFLVGEAEGRAWSGAIEFGGIRESVE